MPVLDTIRCGVQWRAMQQITVAELLAKLSLWKHERSSLLAVMVTTGQIALGRADLDEVTDERVTITLRRVVKHVQLTTERPIEAATFRPKDILAVWRSTTFEQPQHVSLAEHFDAVLQIVNGPAAPAITLWRASPQELQ